LIIGVLAEKKRKKHSAFVEAESLAAASGAVSEVAHDMKAAPYGHWRYCDPGGQRTGFSSSKR